MTQIEHDDDTITQESPPAETAPQATPPAPPPGQPRRFLPRTLGQRVLAGVMALLFVTLMVRIAYTAKPYYALDTSLPDQSPRKKHSRAIIERDGRRLLWARGAPDASDAEWFDVTDSVIDPEMFQYGIGKDTIPSIDAPQFAIAGALLDDPRLAEAKIKDDTVVIGYVHNGDARAYPLHILNRHELVNDTVGGKPVTVGW